MEIIYDYMCDDEVGSHGVKRKYKKRILHNGKVGILRTILLCVRHKNSINSTLIELIYSCIMAEFTFFDYPK